MAVSMTSKAGVISNLTATSDLGTCERRPISMNRAAHVSTSANEIGWTVARPIDTHLAAKDEAIQGAQANFRVCDARFDLRPARFFSLLLLYSPTALTTSSSVPRKLELTLAGF